MFYNWPETTGKDRNRTEHRDPTEVDLRGRLRGPAPEKKV